MALSEKEKQRERARYKWRMEHEPGYRESMRARARAWLERNRGSERYKELRREQNQRAALRAVEKDPIGVRTKHAQRARRWRGKRSKAAKQTAARKGNLRKHGLSLGAYEALLEAQDGVCAICRQPETTRNQFGPVPLAVDHCHRTKRIRGLLCAHCNRAIGLMRDDSARLRAAAAYLERC